MTDVLLFFEDAGHQSIIEPLVMRIASESHVVPILHRRTAAGGRSRVVSELRAFVRDRQAGVTPQFDLAVVATDSNCQGAKWRGIIEQILAPVTGAGTPPVVIVVPNPHVERWMLVDSHAFRTVFGRGCAANEIRASGIEPQLGGIEYGPDVIAGMNLERMITADPSLGAAITDLRHAFQHF